MEGAEGQSWGHGIPEGALGSQIVLPANDLNTLEETIGLSHTILVMRDGVVTRRFDAAPGRKPEQVQLIEHMV